MFKKLLSLFLVLMFIFSLSACDDLNEMTGGDLDGSTGSSDSQNGDTNILEFYEGLQDNDVMPFEITEKAKTTLSEKEDLFIGNNSEGLEEITDTALEYKVLTKNIDKHGDKLIYLSEAYVVSIDETELDEETTFTELQLMDVNENSYYCFALAAYDNIFEEDVVSVYALPIGETAFENVSGGTTLAVVLAGCYIEKCEY